ncbi:MAG: putative quinol monooxygenase, partial [Acetobacteraceae bacterium]
MGGFAILAYFHVVPGRRPEFFDLVGRNAAASLAHEPGCRRFDVLTDASDAGEEVVLYEVYDDAAAFDAHLASPHFSAFRAAT